jgi:hypothetical protein
MGAPLFYVFSGPYIFFIFSLSSNMALIQEEDFTE